MKERGQSGGQDKKHEVSEVSHEKQVPLQVPKQPSHTELQPYIKGQEEPQAIEIERRWEYTARA